MNITSKQPATTYTFTLPSYQKNYTVNTFSVGNCSILPAPMTYTGPYTFDGKSVAGFMTFTKENDGVHRFVLTNNKTKGTFRVYVSGLLFNGNRFN